MRSGAARGLGRAYAERLAGLGGNVAVVDLTPVEATDMTGRDRPGRNLGRRGQGGIEVDVRDRQAFLLAGFAAMGPQLDQHAW